MTEAPVRRRKVASGSVDLPFDQYPLNGLRCTLCGKVQRTTPSGPACVEGHGGVEGVRVAGEPPLDPYVAGILERTKVEIVADLSGQLAEALNPTPPAPSRPASDPVAPQWDRAFGQAISVPDPVALFRRLQDELAPMDPGDLFLYPRIAERLNRAEANYLAAIQLARSSAVEEERYERHQGERLEIMRTSARHALEKEKAAAKLKAPTIQEVEDRMVSSWPEPVAELRDRLSEIKGATRVFDGLARAWESRAETLRQLAANAAKVRS